MDASKLEPQPYVIRKKPVSGLQIGSWTYLPYPLVGVRASKKNAHVKKPQGNKPISHLRKKEEKGEKNPFQMVAFF